MTYARHLIVPLAILVVGGLATTAFSASGCGWDTQVGQPGLIYPLPGPVRCFQAFDVGDGPSLFAAGDFYVPWTDEHFIARWDGVHWHAVGGGVNAPIAALTVFDEGSGPALFVGGKFTSAGSLPIQRLAKWDGTAWSSVPGMPFKPQEVTAMTVTDDGSGVGQALFVAGRFWTDAMLPERRILRWNGMSWSTVATLDGDIRVFHELGQGVGNQLIAAGSFDSINGVNASNIAAWNGREWTALGEGLPFTVPALAVFDDGSGMGKDLFAVNRIPALGGSRSTLMKWNGAAWSAIQTATEGEMLSLYVDENHDPDRLLVGGYFTAEGGLIGQGIAAWDGVRWSSLGDGVLGTVNAITSFRGIDGPTLCIGGTLPMSGATELRRVAAWDGSHWKPIGSGVGNPLDFTSVDVSAMFDPGDGSGRSLFVTGVFWYAGAESALAIGRWDGAAWHNVGSGVWPGSIRDLEEYDDGEEPELYAAGTFDSIGDESVCRLAKWTGKEWLEVDGWDSCSSLDVINALTVYDDGRGGGPALIAAGDDGLGHIEQILPPGEGVWEYVLGEVRALAAQDLKSGRAGVLYAAGQIRFDRDDRTTEVIQWDGSELTAVGSGFSGFDLYEHWPTVHALAVCDGRDGPALIAGGNFHSIAGVQMNYIARWDGETWSPLGQGVNAPVQALAVYDEGPQPMLLVGGEFTMAGGSRADGLAIWDGAQWSPLSAPLGISVFRHVEVRTITIDPDPLGTSIYVGGLFTTAGGQVARRIVRWPCPLSSAYDLNFDGFVDSIDLAIMLAMWGPCQISTPCPADFNDDGVVNGYDLALLLGQWG